MRNPFDSFLGGVLVASYDATGSELWAWRIVRLVHAIPFYAFAFVFGAATIYVWGASDLIQPIVGGALTAGIVVIGTAISWLKEWRRG